MIFEYAPIDPNAQPVLYVIFILTIFSWIMTISLSMRFKERRALSAKLLLIAFVAYSVCFMILTLGLFDMVLSGYKRELYRFSLAFGYGGILIANCFLILFAAEIFSIKKKNIQKYIIINIIIAVFVVLPWNYYGILGSEINRALYIRPYTSLAMVLFSIITYTRIYQQAMRIERLVEQNYAKWGFRFIAYSQIALIFIFIFLLGDTIYFSLSEELTGYTFFNYLAWISASFFFIFSYFGLILPDWLKKILDKHNPDKFKKKNHER